VLLAHVTGVAHDQLEVNRDFCLEIPAIERFEGLLERRINGEPTEYIVGLAEFHGRTFSCDRRAMIPAAETEFVVDRALRAFGKNDAAFVADIGCGTGVIGLTIAAERPLAQVVLTDISAEAAALARENASRLNVAGRVEIREGDLAVALRNDVFDVVLANLPYIADDRPDALPREVRDYEPWVALFTGGDDLKVYQRFFPLIDRHVRPRGLLVVEHGDDHAARIARMLESSVWETPTVEQDAQGLDRVTWAIKR